MIPCEEFESRFPFDQSSEVLEHKRNCPHCAQYSEAMAAVRKSMLAVKEIPAPLGFENRLFSRMDELSSAPSREHRTLPGALAFASGLTLALIAGVVYMNNQIQPIQTTEFAAIDTGITNVPEAIDSVFSDFDTDIAEIVPDSSVKDTSLMKVGPWEKYWETETVSAQP